MNEKPILFSSEMVRAILEGRKTQTRRVMKVQHFKLDGGGTPYIDMGYPDQWDGAGLRRDIECPYGYPGDRLWVQEGYQITDCPSGPRRVVGHYLTDNATFDVNLTDAEYAKWDRRKFPFRPTPGRFMYKSLSRIKPTILNIRVERVQDISEEDAKAEGVAVWFPQNEQLRQYISPDGSYRNGFHELWDSNAKRGYSWKVNPWVWVIEFEK